MALRKQLESHVKAWREEAAHPTQHHPAYARALESCADQLAAVLAAYPTITSAQAPDLPFEEVLADVLDIQPGHTTLHLANHPECDCTTKYAAAICLLAITVHLLAGASGAPAHQVVAKIASGIRD